MTETAHPFESIFAALIQSPVQDGRSPLYALVSPYTQSGTSYVSRELALHAARHFGTNGGRVALIDYDINQQTQASNFDTPRAIAQNGVLQGPFDATFGQTPFWQVSPDMVSETGDRTQAGSYCGLHFVGETGLVVSRFDWNAVRSGQTVHVVSAPDYWQAARAQFSAIFVDCPATDRTDISLNVISDADKTIIVAPDHRTNDPEVLNLAQKITQEGGHCAGVIANAGKALQEFSGYVS